MVERDTIALIAMAAKLIQEAPGSQIKRPPISLSSCKRRIARLERYKYLVSHYTRLAPYVDGIPPLEQLVPEIRNPVDRVVMLPREISRLTPIVYWILEEVGVPTRINCEEPDWDVGPAGRMEKKVTRQYDLVTDFLDHAGDQDWFERLVRVLEEGIGVYLSRMEVAQRERYNPLVWIAWIVRTPITVMEYAGIIPDNHTVARIFAAVLQMLMFLILLFAAIRAGGTIPWGAVVRFMLK